MLSAALVDCAIDVTIPTRNQISKMMHFVCVFNIVLLPRLFASARNRFEREATIVPRNSIVLGRVIELSLSFLVVIHGIARIAITERIVI